MKLPDIKAIYIITNNVTGKIYIGSASNVRTRWNGHLTALRGNRHHSKHLQKAFNKYGENSFSIAVLEEVYIMNDLVKREQYYLDLYKSWDDEIGYNICQFAFSTRGRKVSEETKRKLSKIRTGTVSPLRGIKRPEFSQEWKNKISKANSGTKNSFFGKKHSEETRKKLSEKTKERFKDPTKNPMYGIRLTGEKNGMYGKTHSEDARKKIGAAQKGKTLSEKHIQLLKTRKIWCEGKVGVYSKETLEKMSKNNWLKKKYGYENIPLPKCPICGKQLTQHKSKTCSKHVKEWKELTKLSGA